MNLDTFSSSCAPDPKIGNGALTASIALENKLTSSYPPCSLKGRCCSPVRGRRHRSYETAIGHAKKALVGLITSLGEVRMGCELLFSR